LVPSLTIIFAVHALFAFVVLVPLFIILFVLDLATRSLQS
jgi:hypothetical protein